MLKNDMAKAYDSVDWSFLRSVMQEMSFPTQFIDWVMCCVSSVSYSILINGFPGIPFRAQKGSGKGTLCLLSFSLLLWSILVDI